MHATDPTRRHLHPVPDTGAPEAPEENEPAQDPGGPALRPTRLLGAQDPEPAPEQEQGAPGRPGAGVRLRAAVEAGNTYALFAWHRRWGIAMNYVMDPQLRQAKLDEAEAELDKKRLAAAKRAEKVLDPAEKKAAKKALDRLENRIISEFEVDVRVTAARSMRLMRQLLVPACVVAGPFAAAAAGVWAGFLVWPAAWAWLALQGRAQAQAATTSVTEQPPPAPRAAPGARRPAMGPGARPAAPRGGAGAPPAAPRGAEQDAPEPAHGPEEAVSAMADPQPGAPEAPRGASGAPGSPAPGRQEGLVPTPAERHITDRVDRWEDLAKARGLEGVSPTEGWLEESGLRIHLVLDKRWTLERLRKNLGLVRTMLGVPTSARTEVLPGERADQARLYIRTRRKALDTRWRPGVRGIGLDTDTGLAVDLPAGRKLIAGTSGSGKSVLVRVRIAQLLLSQEPTRVVYIDGKGEESALWEGKVITAVGPEEISRRVAQLTGENERRGNELRRLGRTASWTPTEKDPRIVVIVDEGAEVMAMDSEDTPIMDGLISLARTGRARCIDLEWATQKPTLGDGIDRQINGVMDVRVVLRTAGETETRQVLGSGWPNHTWTGAGWAVVKGTGRDADQAPIAVWDASDDEATAEFVATLPDTGPLAAPAAQEDWMGAQKAVHEALAGAAGGASSAELQSLTGYSGTAVKNALAELERAGIVAKEGGHRGRWRLQ
ncbi:FtsK/SpoIIIE domain-containing protein [Nocardiopsis halophila]|uniref:FtsK/SpoIIIE domain-containing protein n=1 Tax=Nocardiopsis halophila TaxID=141692 RepID=UPI00034CA8A4|nr:FtsK/SpoIIIE domain-containing protein [Nocardiopsis halophila]